MLVLSTLPHYLALLPWIKVPNTTYPHVIFVSSTLSVLWHSYNEPMYTPLYYADHVGAVVWFLYDFQLAIKASSITVEQVMILNLLILVMNLSISPSGALHSVWHILSAMKCIYISGMLVLQHNP